MKQVFKHSLLGVLLISLLASVCFAQESAAPKLGDSSPYRHNGFHIGVGTSVLIPVSDEWFFVVPGKLDFIMGYQVNPYLSFDMKLATIWFIGWQAAVSTKINFTKTRVSPFVTGSIGGAGIFLGDFEEEDDDFNINVGTFLYTAGGGVDIGLTKRSTVYVMAQVVGIPLEYGVLFVPEIGYQWLF